MITLTDSASQKVAELMKQEQEDDLSLRVAVTPGGCSGFGYEIFFDTECREEDSRQTFGDVRVVIDPQSASLLRGAEMDYKDGLNAQGFSISNPNAQRTCGCGQSFC